MYRICFDKVTVREKKKKKLKGGEDNRGRSECEKHLLPPLKGEKKNGKGSEGSKTKVLLSTHIQTL